MSDAGDLGNRPSMNQPEGGRGDRILPEAETHAWGPGDLPKREAYQAIVPAHEEYNLEKYARQTRNATVTLAAIAVVSVICGLIIGLLAVITVVKINDQVNNQTGDLGASSLCQSEGGSLPC
jgi:hypothetical protein